jgi:hypothetical protein
MPLAFLLKTDAAASRDPRGTASDWCLNDAGENRTLRDTFPVMNIALRKTWTPDEFFTWAAAQEGRYEFDGFEPVAMTGHEGGADVGASRFS